MSEDIFEWEFYINKYKDLIKAEINTQEKALEHWNQFGKKEERIFTDIPIFFNWEEYVKRNNDLNYINNEEDAWRHFIYHGQYEGRYIDLKQKKIKVFFSLKK